jgi:hypothetical protein
MYRGGIVMYDISKQRTAKLLGSFCRRRRRRRSLPILVASWKDVATCRWAGPAAPGDSKTASRLKSSTESDI